MHSDRLVVYDLGGVAWEAMKGSGLAGQKFALHVLTGWMCTHPSAQYSLSEHVCKFTKKGGSLWEVAECSVKSLHDQKLTEYHLALTMPYSWIITRVLHVDKLSRGIINFC